MDFQAVQQFIEQNKDKDDVKTYLQGLNPITLDGMQKYVSDNQDAKKWMDSEKDKFFTKSHQTWMEKTFPSKLQEKLEEEIKKRYPDEDPKDKALKEIQLKLAQMEQEKTRESTKAKLLAVAQEKKIPATAIIDLFIGTDEQSSLSNLDKFKEVWDTHLQSAIDERLKSGNYTPPKNNNTGGTLTIEAIKAMSQTEINQRWEEVQKVLANK